MYYDLENKVYICIDNHWFDLTEFKNHPGGVEILKTYHLKDGTIYFNQIRGHYDEYVIGLLYKYEIKNKLLLIYLDLILSGCCLLK